MVNDNSNDENLSFWSRSNTGTILIIAFSIGIPIFLIGINLLKTYITFSVGFDIGNSIALLSAGLAVTGTLYSNYQNNIRNKKQINAAEKRLDIQLEESKKQLHKQLLFNKQREMMIKLYEEFVKMGDGLYPKTSPKNLSITALNPGFSKNNALNLVFNSLCAIRYTPTKLYSLPPNTRKKIMDLVEKFGSNLNPSSIVNPQVETYLDEIFDMVEKYLDL